MWSYAALAVTVAVAGGCSGLADPTECNDAITDQCAPLYTPTFQHVYDMTLAPHCGSGARSCHSEAGRAGGMSFGTIDEAYDALLTPGQDRVIPGDIHCSIMLIRTNSTDSSIQMPRGSSLSAAEKCSLVQWVAQGALRYSMPDAAMPDAAMPDAPIDAGIQ
jgi:hypothetical protein